MRLYQEVGSTQHKTKERVHPMAQKKKKRNISLMKAIRREVARAIG